jgi:negative regulator of flagellin synthesis FlgM
MTINSIIPGKTQPPLPIKAAPKPETDSTKETTTSKSEKHDSVVITALAKEIHKSFESSAASSAVDLNRIAAVKKALADGSYSINAEKIAKKMIQFEKLMPNDNST